MVDYKGNVPSRLSALREELKARSLDGFFVPLTDEHQSEYVAPYAGRLAYLTDFFGSAGSAIILEDKAAIFVDGRYKIQVVDEVDSSQFEICHLSEITPDKWLDKNVKSGMTLGFDPSLHTIGWVKKITTLLDIRGADLSQQDTNPVDCIWSDQPGEPNTEVHAHPDEFAGKPSHDKRAELAKTIEEKGADGAVFSALDSIAWLFNIRSNDVLHTPVSLAYAILKSDGTASLFIDPSKVTNELEDHLGDDVLILPKNEFFGALEAWGEKEHTLLIDPNTASSAIFKAFEEAGGKAIKEMDLVSIPKATKNEAELKGTREAHIRDGASLSRFLHWFAGAAPKGGLDELTVASKLESFRREDNSFKDHSFRTISGAGSNGAMCHYSVNEDTNKTIDMDSIYLVDSGAQYPDGTTDVTRTMAVGTPPTDSKRNYTLVLKGHIALSTAIFPVGTTGPELDPFARRPLWEAGLDYDHGTGHGVGSYLAVHEGPGRISKAPNNVALKPGMIFSNEPGYYKEGEYGIRIENLIVVKEVETKGDRPMLGFENLTWAPLDKNLIDVSILSEDEIKWVNDYHAETFEKISSRMEGDALNWLKGATKPI